MSGAFFSNSVPHGLQPRSRAKPLSSSRGQSMTRRSSARGKPVHVLPQVSEEEEMRVVKVIEVMDEDELLLPPSPSTSRRTSKPRPRGFNGSQDISIETVFESVEKTESVRNSRRSSRATHELLLSPVVPRSPASDDDDDDLSLTFRSMGVTLDFPRPPSAASSVFDLPRPPSVASTLHVDDDVPRSSRMWSLPPMACSPSCVRDSRSSSPTFSLSSSAPPLTPADDATTHTHKQDLPPPLPPKLSKRPSALKLTLAKLDGTSDPDWTDSSDSEDEAAAWYRGEFAEVLTTLSPDLFPTPIVAPATPKTPFAPARPDSLTFTSRRRSIATASSGSVTSARRRSGVMTPTSSSSAGSTRPSSQLDPAYPRRKRSMPRISIPTRPPPPPPTSRSARRTALLTPTTPSSALLTPYSFTSGSSTRSPSPTSPMCSTPLSPRPPPRTPVPANIEDDEDDDGNWAWDRRGSGYDADVSIEVEMDMDMEVPFSPVSVDSSSSTGSSSALPSPSSTTSHPHSRSPSTTATLVDSDTDADPEPTELAWEALLDAEEDEDDWVPSTILGMPIERQVLRSRWSSSTLGADAASLRAPPSLGARLRLKFGSGEKKEKEKEKKEKPPKMEKQRTQLPLPIRPREDAARDVDVPRPRMQQLPPRAPTPSSASAFLAFPGSPLRSPTPAHPRACSTPTSTRSGASSESGGATVVGAGVRRTSSRASHRTVGSDSGESVGSGASGGSNGLRRKAIPVELFMRPTLGWA